MWYNDGGRDYEYLPPSSQNSRMDTEMDASDYTPLKRCSKCGEEKPATSQYWHRDKSKSDGLYPSCKSCVLGRVSQWRKETQYDKKRYWNNHDAEIERNKEYRKRKKILKPAPVRQTPEERAEYKRKWYYDNLESCKDRAKKWYDDNIDYVKERGKKYREQNKQKIKAAKSAAKSLRRARMSNSIGSHTKRDIDRLIRMQESRCAYCGITLYDDYQVDHIVPISRKGSNLPNNLCIACGDCNNSKGNKTPAEWQETRGW